MSAKVQIVDATGKARPFHPFGRGSYEIRAAGDEAEIFIYDVIGDGFWPGGGITAEKFIADLAALKAGTIHVRINSPGGDMFDGIAIHNALARSTAKIVTHVDGLAASIASLIAMAGDEILIAPNAFMMIHNPWMIAIGDTQDMHAAAELLAKFADSMAATYAARSDRAKGDVQTMMDAETWFTAEQAKDEGFADALDAASPEAAKASFDLSIYAKVPAALRSAALFRPAASADGDAGTAPRAPDLTRPCEIFTRAFAAHNQEVLMTTKPKDLAAETSAAQPNNDSVSAAAVDVEAVKRDAVAAERKRGTAAHDRTKAVGLPDEVAQEIVAKGIDETHMGDYLTDQIAARGGVKPALPHADEDHTDPAKIREAMVNCIAARATAHFDKSGRIEMMEQGRQYASFSILEMCGELANARGAKIPARLPAAALYDRLVQASLSSSDFPILLSDASNKILQAAYTLASPTYRLIFARKRFSDFKPHKFIRGGDFPLPLQYGETGEIKYGTMSEAKQEITMVSYGRIIGLSRRVLINDDLGAFADLPVKAGRRIGDFENTIAWAQVNLNSGDGPTITETGRTMCNTTDKTKAGSGAVISVTTVGAGRAAMMKQTSLDGQKLNIMPRFLLTSPDKYTDAEQFCAMPIIPTEDAKTNPFKGRITPVGDANLAGNAWYLFADAADLETLIYGYLDGAEGPQLATREGFTTDGVELKLTEDFVAGAIDYRGAYKNPGA